MTRVAGLGVGLGAPPQEATGSEAAARNASFEHLTASFQQEECPKYITDRTPEQRQAQSFEQCLLEHGRDLDSHPKQCAAVRT